MKYIAILLALVGAVPTMKATVGDTPQMIAEHYAGTPTQVDVTTWFPAETNVKAWSFIDGGAWGHVIVFLDNVDEFEYHYRLDRQPITQSQVELVMAKYGGKPETWTMERHKDILNFVRPDHALKIILARMECGIWFIGVFSPKAEAKIAPTSGLLKI